jgi:NAD-dependent SIR2 family protein deacetylase
LHELEVELRVFVEGKQVGIMNTELDSAAEQTDTLVILGAGFSVPAGLPVTANIWDFASRLDSSLWDDFCDWPLNVGAIQSFSDCIAYLEEFLQRAKIISGSLRDADMEELHSKLLEGSGGSKLWPPTKIALGPSIAPWPLKILYFILFSSLCHRYEMLPYDSPANTKQRAPLPDCYRRFLSYVPHDTTIVSTNYDDIVERALIQSGRQWDYAGGVSYHREVEQTRKKNGTGSYYRWSGEMDLRPMTDGSLIWARLDWRPPEINERADIIFCKPHGSLRWLVCYDCFRTYSVDFWAAFASHFVDRENTWFEDMFFNCWNAECAYSPCLLIVPPIENKSFENHVLNTQWEVAERASQSCRTLIVIGSSLRAADERLVRLAETAGRRAESLIVVNPTPKVALFLENLTRKHVERFESLESFLTPSSNDKV